MLVIARTVIGVIVVIIVRRRATRLLNVRRSKPPNKPAAVSSPIRIVAFRRIPIVGRVVTPRIVSVIAIVTVTAAVRVHDRAHDHDHHAANDHRDDHDRDHHETNNKNAIMTILIINNNRVKQTNQQVSQRNHHKTIEPIHSHSLAPASLHTSPRCVALPPLSTRSLSFQSMVVHFIRSLSRLILFLR